MVQLSANSDAATGATSASYSASSRGGLTSGAISVITERLSELQELALPSSLYRDSGGPAPSPDAVLKYLEALLQKDPASFLARYGGVLQSQELNHFEPLRDSDFEVDHWLRHFAAQQMAAAEQAADPRRLPAQIKNRRLAAMRRLEGEGDYFSEDSMRHRAPLLYHQHIGRYAPPQRPPGQAPEQQQEAQEGQEDQGPGAAGGSGAQGGEEDGGACARPGAGGLGGSCLAAALQQAFARSGGAGPAGSSGGGGSGAAAGEAAGPGAAAGAPVSGHPHPDTHGGSRASPSAAAARGDQPGPSHGRAGGAGPGGGGPGGGSAGAVEGMLRFSDFLLQQNDEAQLEQRRQQEQREEDAQMSEHDSDDDDEGGGEGNSGGEDEVDDAGIAGDGDFMSEGEDSGGAAGAAARRRRLPVARHAGGGEGRGRQRPSPSQLAALRRDFMEEMQSRFLLGQDGAFVDYGTIDADASLDADWIEQESRDAEDRYFDED
ncbi:hypothetical protein HXX76_002922 [Chlamydomonas incerta]|uniref:CCD97-like C-terminal domain-containing protein n=1 Tax=Chlamydomonas incerta TaxID=51695 RepID=A0A835W9A1_CHLIN|nr:hypothetical protein HXX76_002922 [Chlamydomonas incerta]|eukprot:KAG2442843.1 hypothetical protein HXX76_002922 [Chlamydomonas incerta]